MSICPNVVTALSVAATTEIFVEHVGHHRDGSSARLVDLFGCTLGRFTVTVHHHDVGPLGGEGRSARETDPTHAVRRGAGVPAAEDDRRTSRETLRHEAS